MEHKLNLWNKGHCNCQGCKMGPCNCHGCTEKDNYGS